MKTAQVTSRELSINGERRQISTTVVTLEALLDHLGVQKDRVVVEHNLKILKRGEHSVVRLSENDTIEIIRLVGGG